jgi:hypothetical protein
MLDQLHATSVTRPQLAQLLQILVLELQLDLRIQVHVCKRSRERRMVRAPSMSPRRSSVWRRVGRRSHCEKLTVAVGVSGGRRRELGGLERHRWRSFLASSSRRRRRGLPRWLGLWNNGHRRRGYRERLDRRRGRRRHGRAAELQRLEIALLPDWRGHSGVRNETEQRTASLSTPQEFKFGDRHVALNSSFHSPWRLINTPLYFREGASCANGEAGRTKIHSDMYLKAVISTLPFHAEPLELPWKRFRPENKFSIIIDYTPKVSSPILTL